MKETALKCHDSTFYVTPTELVNMDFVSVRSRLLKNAISEIKEHNKEYMQVLKSAGLAYEPALTKVAANILREFDRTQSITRYAI